MYAMSAQLQGLAFHGVPLTADFELDEAAMLAAIAKHKPPSSTWPIRTTRPPTCGTTR
jgi:histidinol-phosphate/aromatic aminotransferase/cobyric acid decarboxylase-like protein